MASDSTSLLTTEEASGLIGLVFGPDEPEAIAWSEMDEQGQLRCLIRATADFNRIVWKGRDVATTQRHRWPRKAIQYPHAIVTDRAGEDTSSDFTPNMPIAIRRALVAQAATRAATELGFDDADRIAKAAAQGVTSQGGGGMNESIDQSVARSPWARLCLRAQEFAEPFRAYSAEGV